MRVICVNGGPVTTLEAREMSKIIEDAKSDAAKSGIRCRVSDERMSFWEFLCEFDPSWSEDDDAGYVFPGLSTGNAPSNSHNI